ncbi:MAG: GntR family transcriptional regulator [Chloroflexi bacterium]|nr:GntR family transcriptional regulator [Chloroflexota bacterium]
MERLISLAGTESSPVYLQLADQLRYLIRTGELPVGARLPTARHLAANLGINRNTVMSAYSTLAREGYVRGNRRGGTRVVGMRMGDPAEVPPLQGRLITLADELVDAGAKLGMRPEEIGSLVEHHARLRAERQALGVCFVECNPTSLSYFVDQLEHEFGIRIQPALLSDLGLDSSIDFSGLDCVISTFYHLSEVRRALQARGSTIELFAIAVRPHLSVVDALEGLPPGSLVGVAYMSSGSDRALMEERLRRMTEAVEQTKVRGIRVKPILVGGSPDPRAFEGLAAVVVRPENIAQVRSAIPDDVRVIEFTNMLDASAKHFLREVFTDLAVRPRHLPDRVSSATPSGGTRR